jgi:hypothetical protein
MKFKSKYKILLQGSNNNKNNSEVKKIIFLIKKGDKKNIKSKR